MKRQLTAQDIPALTEYMAGKMTAQKNALAKLDSLTGDGDMGVTVVLAFKAMTRACKRTGGMGIGEIFALFSEEVGENAPSTFGTFIAAMLLGMSEALMDVSLVRAEELARALEAAGEKVMARGGAKPGDKTLLDALVPAAQAARKCADAGEELSEASRKAAQAAAAGAAATEEMKAVTGRAGYMGERTVGSRDPGAEAISLLLQYFDEFVQA